MINHKNTLKSMIMDCDVDGKTIKDRTKPITHPDVHDVTENIDDYYITSFNRDGKKGIRYLELNTVYTR